MEELREERQAAALRRVARAAASRDQARRAEQEATTELRREVIDAITAGVTTRRVAQMAGISLDTINRWAPRKRSRASAAEPDPTEPDPTEPGLAEPDPTGPDPTEPLPAEAAAEDPIP